MSSPISSYSFLDTISSTPKGAVIRVEKRDSNEILAIKCQNIEPGNKHHHSHQRENDKNRSKNLGITVPKRSSLKKEAKVYKLITGAPGFPVFKQLFSDGTTEHLVLELLGPNLPTLIEKSQHNNHSNIPHLSLKSVLQIADQGLLKIEYLHKKGYVHGDLTPSNFVIGLGNNSNLIYLLDMSHATRYREKESDELLPFSDKAHNQGNPTFSSINSQKDWKLSRRDDIESFGYILVYLLTGTLPWLRYSQSKDILYCKMNTLVKHLCDGIPSEFAQFINSARCLEFTDEPDYSGYRQLFRNLFINQGYLFDYSYDWTTKEEPEKQKFYHCDANSKTISLTHNQQPIYVNATTEIKNAKMSKPKTISPSLYADASALAHQQACASMLNVYVHEKRHSSYSISLPIGQSLGDNQSDEPKNANKISKISPSTSTPTTIPKASPLSPDLLQDQSTKRRGSHTPTNQIKEDDLIDPNAFKNSTDKKASQDKAKKLSKKRRLLICPS